jgi:hypothetical protein
MLIKKAIALTFVTVIGIIIFSTIAFTSNNGKAAKTGAPGENACNQCHSTNALNSGGGSVTISSPDLVNWSYVPGFTYNINVKVKKTGVGKFGFCFEALLPSGANAGLISTTGSPNAKSLAATVLGNSRNSAVHMQPNNFGTDSLIFTFQWTAPAAGTGNITFYAAGNATNSSNSSSGDFIYTTNQLITEMTSANLQAHFKDKLLVVSPNPCVNFIHFSLPKGLSQNSTIFQLFDMQGINILSENIYGSTYKIDIQNHGIQIKEGIYLVHLQNGPWEHLEKIIVTK